MNMKLDRYLHSHRRRCGLTQQEVGYLLGLRTGTVISRLEKSRRTPSLSAALACQVIFGITPAEIFPYIYEEVEADIMTRANVLHEKLQGKKGKAVRAKLNFLEGMMDRATDRT